MEYVAGWHSSYALVRYAALEEAFALAYKLRHDGDMHRVDVPLAQELSERGRTTDDPQSPHGEDELYYVVSGRGRVRVGAAARKIQPGSLVFVAATVPHTFYDIAERLELLVVFGPAEGSRG